MKIRVVGDIITVRGIGFAGVDGAVAETADEARAAIRRFLAEPGVGLVLVAQSLAAQLGEEFDEYKIRKEMPLVLNIPDRTGAGGDNIENLVQKTLGIRV
ncbi:hypothetical protein GX586_06960 [bacterium]|nr:hypothetical protein [bacterium]